MCSTALLVCRCDPNSLLHLFLALQFAQKYFESGGREAIVEARRQHSSSASGDVRFPSAEELQRRIAAIFHEADKDSNHFLDRREFKKCLQLFAQELDLKVSDLRHIQVYADENNDGMISYEEFVPVAVELLTVIFAKKRHEWQQAQRQQQAAQESAAYLLNGMPREELEAALTSIFQAADSDNSGELDRKEFVLALKNSDLGLTKKQIHLLADEADTNGDGHIQYVEALPVMFGLLTELVAKQLEYDALPAEEAGVAAYLMDVFAQYDGDGTGRLRLDTLKEALHESDIGLTKLQLRSVMSLAKPAGPAQDVDYKVFAARACSMLSSIIKVSVDSEKAQKLLLERTRGAFAAVNGLDRESFSAALASLLSAVSPEGTGRAHVNDLQAALLAGGEGLALSEDQAGALVNLAVEGDLAADGTVALAFVQEYAFDTLQSLSELQALQGY